MFSHTRRGEKGLCPSLSPQCCVTYSKKYYRKYSKKYNRMIGCLAPRAKQSIILL